MRPILESLPHRPPFLFLDEIVSVEASTVHARRVVRADEPQFAGHYPGKPIMPGVLLCEAVLQAGCYLMVSRLGSSAVEGGVPVVTRMSDVKFRRMVKPGDVLDITAEYEKSILGAHFMKGAVRVGGKLAASLGFAVMLAPEAAEDKG